MKRGTLIKRYYDTRRRHVCDVLWYIIRYITKYTRNITSFFSPAPSIIISFESTLCDSVIIFFSVIVELSSASFFEIKFFPSILLVTCNRSNKIGIKDIREKEMQRWKIFLPRRSYRGSIIFESFDRRWELTRDKGMRGGQFFDANFFRKSFLEMLKNISKRGRKEEADGGSVAFVLHRSFTGPRVADNILTSFKSNEVYTHETRLKRGTHRLGPAHRCTSQAVPIHLIHAPLKKFYSVRFQPSSSPSSFAR